VSDGLDIRSDIAGAAWPPVSNGQNALLFALLRQFEETQWQPPALLSAMQHRQLHSLAVHAQNYSPHFRDRLARAGLTPDDLLLPEGLRRLPELRRRELQGAADLFCSEVPAGHAPLTEGRTSGSTGEPVVVKSTAINRFDWFALTLREHLWHRRDAMARFCAIRPGFAAPRRGGDWGLPFSAFSHSGPFLGLPITTDIDRQIDELVAFAPEILLVYPSNLAAILRRCAVRGIGLPTLRHIQTVGETLPPQLRDQVRDATGLEIADIYSSTEAGYIACTCPQSGLYHVVETVLVEILDAGGAPCAEGEVGRVVVSDLRNFATPLIRYDIGDYAQAGPPCPCGRGLPTLRRLHGRERNLILMPDGTRHWPLVGFARFREIAPVIQYQLIQDGRESVEVRLVVARALTQSEEDALAAHIREALGFAFALCFVYFDRQIPLGANGKFEEFVCRLAPP
jgi:phenylacetate-CoA ligase